MNTKNKTRQAEDIEWEAMKVQALYEARLEAQTKKR